MAMNVMLLEDRGSIAVTLKELLEFKGYIVHEAYNPADAQGLISGEEGVDIQAIILDLNLPTDGLDKEKEVPQTNNGLFSGWVWFCSHVYPRKPEMLERTIIYSAYLDDLTKYLEKHGEQEAMELLNEMRKIKKREGSSSPVEELLMSLDTIEKQLKRNGILK